VLRAKAVKSFAAMSWIIREEKGAWLVDCITTEINYLNKMHKRQ